MASAPTNIASTRQTRGLGPWVGALDYYIRNCCLFAQILAGGRLQPLPLAPSPPAATARQRGESDGEGERG